MTDPWGLPSVPTHILLDRDELLALDWHLCGHYLCNVGQGLDIREIIAVWGGFRETVWAGIEALSTPTNIGVPLPPTMGSIPEYRLSMDEATAKYLFNWFPPTFMWGTGRDCGFTLKVKLRRFLAGEGDMSHDDPNTTEGSAKNQAVADS